ncbi:MAG TPA: lactonase family protein [Candidatus Paceibacterota bacterium]|nr:lactonase family protein [Verrucomicrobiota bacterium]HOX03530.1 lactonase family protein [Verrucomicrobiota bacterium]HRZ46422.1 lactonase family protein [Candidatus Paceibacterota bacterium]HRZ93704.1 lactonase family protein [Candidatus Paceibacterota bacterium]
MKTLSWIAMITLFLSVDEPGVSRGAEAGSAAPPPAECLVYFGTYTGRQSQGIYVARMQSDSGRLTAPELAAAAVNPSFLALHPNGRYLYAVTEMGGAAGKRGEGGVSAFEIERGTGRLALLNQESSGGAGPCHLAVDPTGRWVLVANYGGGSTAMLPVGTDGRLGKAAAFVQHEGSSVNPRRQTGPHAHGVYLDATGRRVWVPDLGLDKVLAYNLDLERGALRPHDPPAAAVKPGAGPRHMAFRPDGRFAYVINELDSTVTVFRHQARVGRMVEIQSITTLPQDFSGENSTAEIFVHPSGRFLYGSNRGHDSIVAYAIDGKTGRLTYLEHQPTQGKTPRSFNLDPAGRFLLAANQQTHNVTVFRVDPATGRLTPTGQPLEVGSPVCIVFLPALPPQAGARALNP